MSKSEKIIRNIIIGFSIMIVILLLGTLLFDYFDLRKYYPFNHFTTEYDWLGIIGAIIGGLIGATGTYIGIHLTIKNEHEENKKKDIEERKRNGYSYITFADDPISLKISLDSILTGNLDNTQSYLIGENITVQGANYFNIEFKFKCINNCFPTAVIVEDVQINYGSSVKDNKKMYNQILNLSGYKKGFKRITIKNDNIITFDSIVMINKKQLENIKEHLIESEFIDVITNVKFINANGVITEGRFWTNLIKEENIKVGSEKCLGSNKEKISYKAENNYLMIKNIDYKENYGNEIFGGK